MAVMSHCSLYQIQRGRGVGERLLLCASLDPKHPHVSAWSIPMFAAKKKKKKRCLSSRLSIETVLMRQCGEWARQQQTQVSCTS